MIAKEGLPGLQWPILPGHHVDRNRGLGDLDTQLEQFAMDLGGAPQRVLNAHSSDQIAHFFNDRRTPSGRTGFPPPVSGKTHSMPTQPVDQHDGLDLCPHLIGVEGHSLAMISSMPCCHVGTLHRPVRRPGALPPPPGPA